jgi:hypothetical protein
MRQRGGAKSHDRVRRPGQFDALMTLALCAERVGDATIFPSSAQTNHRDIFRNLGATILCCVLTDAETNAHQLSLVNMDKI